MSKTFLWVPGNGYDTACLARIQNAFVRPPKPMGEAWFMGEKRYLFNNLQTNDLSIIPAEDFAAALEAISSGTINFSHFSDDDGHDEWRQWYHYLLAHLIPRAHERPYEYLLEHLVNAFFALYPDNIQEPYPGFHHDILHTLGKCMMDTHCWHNQRSVIGNILCQQQPNTQQIWHWYDASGDLSASLFFCLKYLPSNQIEHWLRSVMDIDCHYWRAQLMVWFVGANDLLTGVIKQPGHLSDNAYPAIDWAWSHIIKSDHSDHFIALNNRQTLLTTLQQIVNQNAYQQWLDSIAQDSALSTELGDLPQQFKTLYIDNIITDIQ